MDEFEKNLARKGSFLCLVLSFAIGFFAFCEYQKTRAEIKKLERETEYMATSIRLNYETSPPK